MRRSWWIFSGFIVMGGLLGGILGEILRVIAPQGTTQKIFATALAPGIDPPLTLDLVMFTITLGFTIKMNLLTFLGMLLGLYLYKQF